MAYALEVLVVDPGDQTIKVGHTFYGVTQEEVKTYYREHMESCEYFRAAVNEGRTIEEMEKIDDEDLPEVETDDDPD